MSDARQIEADIYERLSKVIDPELGRSVTDLGMIAAIEAAPASSDAGTYDVTVHVELRVPGCPLSETITSQINGAVSSYPGAQLLPHIEVGSMSRDKLADLVADLKAEYARIADAYFAREITRETLGALPERYTPEERAEAAFARREQTERALFEWLFGQYARRCPVQYQIPAFLAGVAASGSPEAYAGEVFDTLWREGADTTAVHALHKDTERMLGHIGWMLETKSLRNLNSGRLNELYTTYIKGLREWDTLRAFYPDANLTLRVAYGHVGGYEYADGEYHKPQTTLDGIIAKDNPEIYDYDIPQALRELYATKDYGRWATTIDGRRTVPVCFLATNHTTGGNSGSPIINGRGELVGLNFDRTWRSTMSDVAFDETICRNIAVDVRYVLFVIDRIGGAGYLFGEMDFSRRK